MTTSSNVWHGPAELRGVIIFLKQFGTAMGRSAFPGGTFAATAPGREEAWTIWIDDPVWSRPPRPEAFGNAYALAIDARENRDVRQGMYIREARFGFSINIESHSLAFAGLGRGTRGHITDMSFLLLALFSARVVNSDELNTVLTRKSLKPYFANEIRKEIARLVPLCHATTPILQDPVAA